MRQYTCEIKMYLYVHLSMCREMLFQRPACLNFTGVFKLCGILLLSENLFPKNKTGPILLLVFVACKSAHRRVRLISGH